MAIAMQLHLRRLGPDQQSSAGGQSAVSSLPQGSFPATLHLHHGLPPAHMHDLTVITVIAVCSTCVTSQPMHRTKMNAFVITARLAA